MVKQELERQQKQQHAEAEQKQEVASQIREQLNKSGFSASEFEFNAVVKQTRQQIVMDKTLVDEISQLAEVQIEEDDLFGGLDQ